MAKNKGRPMVKRFGVIVVALVALALAVSMVLPAGAQDDESRTIRVASVTAQERFLDLGQQGFSLGDEFVFSANLMRQGERVGRLGVECTVTSTRTEDVQCVATARFGNGQITVQGLLRGEPESFLLAVTGGTGAYLGTEGSVHVQQVSDTREILTFHLED
jgi:Allene oxide cyclase barrel like domain